MSIFVATEESLSPLSTLLTHQYHVTSRDVHIRLSWLFAPGWGGAVGGRWAVLRTIAELGGNAADAGRVRTSAPTGTRAYGWPGHAPTDPTYTVLTAQGRFRRHVLPT